LRFWVLLIAEDTDYAEIKKNSEVRSQNSEISTGDIRDTLHEIRNLCERVAVGKSGKRP